VRKATIIDGSDGAEPDLQRLSRFSILLGIVPVKKLLYSPIATRLDNKPISEGTVPMREQSLRNRWVKWLKLERFDGIVPLK